MVFVHRWGLSDGEFGRNRYWEDLDVQLVGVKLRSEERWTQ